MALTPGTRLGPYEVVAPIGEGGMGQVYRARDTKLNRDVALKVLPDSFATDPDRLARFQREAQVLASLNHPNIAHIHGLEDSGGVRALVMELVEGEDLAQRLTRGAIPIDEALPIAKQIAEALEAAHEQGIIHRDLKPANIKVTPDGRVKVLDFGLAKAMEPAGVAPNMSQSPTITTPAMTQAGVILGTAAYMSPEQARGRPADKRSDIWAFGCVLYDMLTGKRAFDGADVSDTLVAVLRDQPDWSALPADVTEPIRVLLRRCLEKDRSKRISDIAVAQFLMVETGLATPHSGAPLSPSRVSWQRVVLLASAAGVGAALAGIAAWVVRPPYISPTVTRLAFRVPDDERFTNTGRPELAISPDGKRMVYVANQRLYLREMGDANARPIIDSRQNGGVTSPAFSPDGQWVAFWSAPGTLNKVAVIGGPPVKLADINNPFGMSWGAQSLFIGGGPQGILRVPDKGGSPEQVIRVKENESAYGPHLLPDGRSILFTVSSGTDIDRWDKGQIVVQALGSSDRKTVIKGGADGRYVQTGHIVYAIGGDLFAQPFSVSHLETLDSSPVPVVSGVARATGGQTGAAQFSVSETGTLMYLPGASTTRQQSGFGILALVDKKGNVTRLKLDEQNYQTPRFSPNGQQLAVTIDDGRDTNIWLYDLNEKTEIRQLTFGGKNRFPVWTRDGSRIAFQSDRGGSLSIFWQRADGKESAEPLTKAEPPEAHMPSAWSADGDTLLFSARTGSGQYALRTFTLHDRKITPVADVRSTNEPNAGFRPDGRWLAYTLPGSGGDFGSIWVRPFPATAEQHRIGYGVAPFWSPDGKSLYFVATAGADAFSVVNVTTEPSFSVSEPRTVPRPAIIGGGPNLGRQYDVAPDNGEFVVVTIPNNVVAAARDIEFVLNWTEELKQRVPTK